MTIQKTRKNVKIGFDTKVKLDNKLLGIKVSTKQPFFLELLNEEGELFYKDEVKKSKFIPLRVSSHIAMSDGGVYKGETGAGVPFIFNNENITIRTTGTAEANPLFTFFTE